MTSSGPKRVRIFADLVRQMPELVDAAPAVWALGSHAEVTEVCLAAVEAVFDRLDHSLPLSKLVPGVPAQIETAPQLLPADLSANWSSLVGSSPRELLQMPSMGRRRAIRLLAAAVLASLDHDAEIVVDRAVRLVAARMALLRDEASVADALEALGSDDPVIAAARRTLADLATSTFLNDELLPLVDPVNAAASFRADLDDRHRLVLDRRLAAIDVPQTLQAIAGDLGVSRERVRQIQQAVESQVATWKMSDAARAPRAAADQLARVAGLIYPVESLPAEWHPLRGDVVPPELGLVLYLAGPYRRDESWLVRADFLDWRDRVGRAIEEVLGPDRTAPLELGVAAAEALGISPSAAENVIVGCGRFRHIGDRVVDWVGNLANRAEVVLASAQRPLSAEDIAQAIREGVRKRSVTVALASDDRFHRSGDQGWALRAWGGQRYPGAFNALLDALDVAGEAELVLDEVVADLAAGFGLDADRLRSTAMTTPLVVISDGHVRRRRPTEPYRSARFLKDTRDLFSVEGAWSFRCVVDESLLRGAPVAIPDSFATYLGMQPGTSGHLVGPVRPVPLAWDRHEPRIGSIRREASLLQAHPGDLLFVRRVTLTELEFRLVRISDCDVSDPALRVARLVGADPGAVADPLKVVGAALGLGGAVAYSASDLVARLRERGDNDVLEALLALLNQRRRPESNHSQS